MFYGMPFLLVKGGCKPFRTVQRILSEPCMGASVVNGRESSLAKAHLAGDPGFVGPSTLHELAWCASPPCQGATLGSTLLWRASNSRPRGASLDGLLSQSSKLEVVRSLILRSVGLFCTVALG